MHDLIIGPGAFAIAADLPAGLPVPALVCRRASGGIVSTNLAARDLFHWRLGETMPPDWSFWARFEDATICHDLIARLEMGDQINNLEAALRCQDDAIIWVLISARTTWHGGEPAVIATFSDVTALKEREAAQAQKLEQQAAEAGALMDRIHDLDEKLRQAEAASEAKSTFLTEMSHELRSPLNAILGFAEIIRDRHFGDQAMDRYADYAGLVHTAGSHLLDLINDILDLSKIESGKLALNFEKMDPTPLLRECAELILPTITRRSLTIDLTVDVSLMLRADPRRLKQMVLNLLSNAAKFTPAGGHIRLSAKRLDDDCTAIMVSDNGIGMTSDDISLALQPFGQIQQRHTDEADRGTGLGLPIVKSLIELHGGRFIIDSIQERGTTIALIFPNPS